MTKPASAPPADALHDILAEMMGYSPESERFAERIGTALAFGPKPAAEPATPVAQVRGYSGLTEAEELRDVLLRNGFVECDIAACMCGSWHHRYGIRERMNEITDELRDADVLDNSTGNLPLRAVQKLRAQRDEAGASLAACRADAERYRWLRDRSHLQDGFEFWIDSVSAIDYKPAPQLNDMHETLDAAIDAARAVLPLAGEA